MVYAEVIVTLSHKNVDKAFHYKIPETMQDHIQIGSRVFVPFGKGDKKYEGYVVGFSDTVDFPEHKAKSILAIGEGETVFSEELLSLAKWMQNKCFTTLYDCLKCMIPTGLQSKGDYVISLNDSVAFKIASARQKEVVDFILNANHRTLLSELENEFGNRVSQTVDSLKKKSVLQVNQVSEFKDLALKVKFAFLNYENESLEEILEEALPKDTPQSKVLRLLSENDGVSVSDIKTYLHISGSPIQTLAKHHIIVIEEMEVLRNTIHYEESQMTASPELTDDQKSALSFIENKKDQNPVLIHGVTGSGKTEIYLHIIEKVLEEGKQAIVLVPEISLTPQTVSVFIARFGNLVSVTHSRLTLGERYDQWKKAKNGQTSIMIGPRSAVFTPFERLGVIIIDEEHEKTYKSETSPKYSVKEVAIERGRLAKALVILGSATPSVESYFEAESGKMDLITISERVNKKLPDVSIVDMRNELAEGNMSIFSKSLLEAMEENIKKNEQTILFLNRRGHSTFVSCRKCGNVITCDGCNVNYTYHRYSDKLICHYCGKKIKNPENCPVCGSKFIKYFGIGTQRVEDETKKLFPEAKVLRMDMDTTSGKHTHEKILTAFKNGEAQILIGTQMIAKGLDFPHVTLVGIIAADLSLNTGDFRSGETSFQLLTQVSGRAGRAEIHGRVFIQTYNPEHYSILYAKDNDYKQFYQHEISLRRQMFYPPFSYIFSILFTGEQEKEIIISLFELLDIMKYYNRKNLFEMVGPAPATISKIKKQYRWKMIVKSIDEEKLKNFSLYCIDKLKEKKDMGNIAIHLTLNPVLLV